MKKEKQIIYYKNELEDEFSQAQITPKKIDGTYSYSGGIGRKIGRIFWYHMAAKPIATVFLKLKFRHKIINRQCVKKYAKTGFFLYGNHTHELVDALIPTMICRPKGVYVIVHPNNVSMPLLGRITPSLGALPLPDDMDAMKNFNRAIAHHMEKKHCITIYPEAHIWPYYTKIRDFKDNSFRYPVQYDVPTFCFVNTYQKRKYSKTPKIVTYVEGPFFADKKRNAKQQREALCHDVKQVMTEHAKHSDVERIKYIKVEETE